MLDSILYRIKKFIPKKLFDALAPAYHYMLSFLAAVIYGFPSRKIRVVGITGTKGKSSVVEIVSAILENAGYSVASSSTIRFKSGAESRNNLYKMTLPGRFFLQNFLRKAVRSKCRYAIIEFTSEGAKLFRHKFVSLDALIFTNLTPEHIESHGSFDRYVRAKLSLAKALENSSKKNKAVIANIDDKYGKRFLNIDVPEKYGYSLADAKPYSFEEKGIVLTFLGEKIYSKLRGKFNVYNMLAAATFAKSQNVDIDTIKRALENIDVIPGRVEQIMIDGERNHNGKRDFSVIVDYAHTADSMRQLYDTFPNKRKICVFGATGGGRDKWKRKEMGAVADRYCDRIILTNDDPYDEDPVSIAKEIKGGIKRTNAEIIVDRRKAIRAGISYAKTGDVVLITGKGTDPYLMLPNNKKLPWSDADTVREELAALLESKN